MRKKLRHDLVSVKICNQLNTYYNNFENRKILFIKNAVFITIRHKIY